MKHKLKTNQEYMEAIRSGAKAFEIRRDDRGFKEGDILWLKGWDNVKHVYTGDELKADVTYIMREKAYFGLADGFCLMGIKVREKPEVKKPGPYVEDLACLDEYPGLRINGVRWSGDHALPYRAMTIQWSSDNGFGQVDIGLDADGAAHCDTEYMSGDFVRAIMTLFFLEANPLWDPRTKKIDEDGIALELERRNLAELADHSYYHDNRVHINEHVNRKGQ